MNPETCINGLIAPWRSPIRTVSSKEYGIGHDLISVKYKLLQPLNILYEIVPANILSALVQQCKNLFINIKGSLPFTVG
jgi:hypothetical protein